MLAHAEAARSERVKRSCSAAVLILRGISRIVLQVVTRLVAAVIGLVEAGRRLKARLIALLVERRLLLIECIARYRTAELRLRRLIFGFKRSVVSWLVAAVVGCMELASLRKLRLELVLGLGLRLEMALDLSMSLSLRLIAAACESVIACSSSLAVVLRLHIADWLVLLLIVSKLGCDGAGVGETLSLRVVVVLELAVHG